LLHFAREAETDASKSEERFYDAEMRVNFFSFSQAVNAVLHQEGDVTRFLVSNRPPADILALLRGKSAHA
jgi:hypothetical protein